MVDKQRDSERVGEDTANAGAADADPTLDIVRQLIVEAEALPAPAKRPPGPATPRPGAPAAAQGPVQGPVPAPAQAAEPVAEPAPAQDAVAEAWDDAPEDDDWDDLALSGGVRPYGIVDPETGEVVYHEGAEDDPSVAAPRRPRKRLLRRWLGVALRAIGRWTAAALRVFAAWAAVRLAAARRVIARFLRRPDAPRRLAVSLLVIFVIAWPWKVLSLTLLVPLAALITWASVGNDGCVELIVRWHSWIKAGDADKAERIRLRAKAVSAALERGLERLPERWTQGLYLPDFEPEGYVPEKLQVDPFEDLAARVHSAKRAGGH